MVLPLLHFLEIEIEICLSYFDLYFRAFGIFPHFLRYSLQMDFIESVIAAGIDGVEGEQY